MNISQYMTQIHRDCDHHFAQSEKAISSGQWEQASRSFQSFLNETQRHFRVEENVLFPEIEEFIGHEGGPTAVMRDEHEQLNQVLADLGAAIEKKESGEFRAAADTFMIMLQQHNMKEEQVLYPMADQMLADEAGRILSEMQAV